MVAASLIVSAFHTVSYPLLLFSEPGKRIPVLVILKSIADTHPAKSRARQPNCLTRILKDDREERYSKHKMIAMQTLSQRSNRRY